MMMLAALRLRDFTAAIAGFVLAVMLCLVAYEGLPIGPLRLIPWVGPKLELITGGRVDREREAARQGYVTLAELAAAKAQLAETQRQLEAGRKAAAGFAEMLAVAQAREAAAQDQIEQRIADYEKQLAAAGRSCLLDQHDLDWLSR